jgi:2'-5' RNA ligase
MPYAIELFFDSATSQGIQSVWSKLAESSGSHYMIENGVYPHVALTVFDLTAFPTAALFEKLNEVASGLTATALSSTGVHYFPGQQPVVYMGLEKCAFLFDAHRHVVDVLDRLGISSHEYYRSDRWVPHCTLAMKFQAERLERTLEDARQLPTDKPFQAVELALIEFSPTKLVWRKQLDSDKTIHPVFRPRM